jgi:hypothetical protein
MFRLRMTVYRQSYHSIHGQHRGNLKVSVHGLESNKRDSGALFNETHQDSKIHCRGQHPEGAAASLPITDWPSFSLASANLVEPGLSEDCRPR